jgi:hypothetical protein
MRRRFPPSIGSALALAALSSACGSSSNTPGDASRDAPLEVASDAPGDGGTDAGDGPPFFSLGLLPPAVDCRPYAGLGACAIRVAMNGSASADGLTWQTPLANVQDALDRATCGCDVWIASGTFLPTMSLDAAGDPPDPRNRSFVLWPRVRVLGGFGGAETDPSQRLATGAPTLLSGDLGVAGSADDNTYHVVVGAEGATLDGLTLSGGEANGFLLAQSVGAGVLMLGADMTLRDLTISGNDAEGSGAGVFADGRSSVHVTGCTFAGNTSNDGGGLVVLGPSAIVENSVFQDNVGVFSGPAITQFADALTVTDSHFFRNRGDSGGAVTASGGHATFDRCWFEGNQAGSFGGAMLVRFGAAASVRSSVFVANGSVGFGGALAVWTSTLDVEGASIVDDYAFYGGAFLVKDGSTFSLADSVVWRSLDDAGHAFDLDGAPSTLDVHTSDVPSEVPAVASFDVDAKLVNVPLTTRFAEEAGDVGHLPVASADKVFAPGDRIELGDDGVARMVTSVSGDDVSFAPPLSAAAPRFLRVDLWAPSAPDLDLDLAPAPGSPLIDAAGPNAPALDVFDHPRVRAADMGAIEAP